jgi:hypothetical protein
MSQVGVMRHKVLVERQKIRRVARELGVSRNRVKLYGALATPPRVERTGRKHPVRNAAKPRLEQVLKVSPKCTGDKHHPIPLCQ